MTAAPEVASRILVVEDEALIAHDIENRLKRAGFAVPGVVDTGEHAVGMAGQVRPDLVLMDIRLKGPMDGIEAAAQIRRLYDIPVVYLTAHADRDTLNRAKTAEPFGYLTKPLGGAALPTTIEVALFKHQVERRLREREAWLTTTLQSVAEAVVVTGVAGDILFLNPEAERLTRVSQSFAAGRKVEAVVRLLDQHGVQDIQNLVTLSVLHGGPVPLPRSAILWDAGDHRTPVDGSVAVSRAGDAIVGAVMVFRDATREQKQHLRMVNGQKVAAVSRLAAGIALDLGMWVEITSSCSEELLQPATLPSSAREKLQLIRRTSLNVKEMLRGLRSFSAPALTRKESEDVNTVIEGMLPGLKSMLGDSIRVETQLTGESAWVSTGCGQLEHILLKLAMNARDAMPKGGVLRLATEIVQTLPAPGSPRYKAVRLSVGDSGTGISPDIAEQLFEPFVTTKEGRWNAGLGLTMIHRAVTELDGDIEVASEPGRGTLVSITLPALETRAMPSASGVILLVERYGAVRNFIQGELEQHDLSVVTAEDGEEALALAEIYHQPIHLVVAHLPALGGNYREVLGAVRVALPDVKILLLTEGRSERDPIPENCTVLGWPFSKTELLDRVRELQSSRPGGPVDQPDGANEDGLKTGPGAAPKTMSMP